MIYQYDATGSATSQAVIRAYMTPKRDAEDRSNW